MKGKMKGALRKALAAVTSLVMASAMVPAIGATTALAEEATAQTHYYHWDFTASAYDDQETKTVISAAADSDPDTPNIEYGATSTLTHDATGLSRIAKDFTYNQVPRIIGGVQLQSTQDFAIQFTASVTSGNLFLSCTGGNAAQHPYVWWNGSNFTFGGAGNPNVSATSAEAYAIASSLLQYSIVYDTNDFYLTIKSADGVTTYVDGAKMKGANRAPWTKTLSDIFPAFNNDGYKMTGTITDLKVSIGNVSCNVTASAAEGTPADSFVLSATQVVNGNLLGEGSIVVSPANRMYKVTNVTATCGIASDNGDGTWTVSNITSDTVLTVTTASTGNNIVDSKEATCEEDGYEKWSDGTETVFPALGHIWGDPVEITAPAVGVCGKYSRTCSRCSATYIFRTSATNANYYHWNFKDTSTYVLESDKTTIVPANDSTAIANISYSADSLTLSSENGLERTTKEFEAADVATIDGGAKLSIQNGFAFELTGKWTGGDTSKLWLGSNGSAGGQHPYFFVNAKDSNTFRLNFGGSSHNFAFVKEVSGINYSESTTFRVVYNGDNTARLTISQNGTVLLDQDNIAVTNANAKPEYILTTLFPYYSGMRATGTIEDLKVWTSYFFTASDQAAEGTVSGSYEITGDTQLTAESSCTLVVAPKGGYAIEDVTVEGAQYVSTPQADGTVSVVLSNATSDPVVTVKTSCTTDFSNAITFMGGSLRMDSTDFNKTSLRFGYCINAPEGYTVDSWNWNYYGNPANVHTLTGTASRPVTAAESAKGLSGIVSNLVITNIGVANYESNVYSKLTVVFKNAETEDLVTITESVYQPKSVAEIAGAIVGSNTATEAEKEYANNILDAYGNM